MLLGHSAAWTSFICAHSDMAGSGYESIGILYDSIDVYSWDSDVTVLFDKRVFHDDDLEKKRDYEFVEGTEPCGSFCHF